jgi:cathepsin X
MGGNPAVGGGILSSWDWRSVNGTNYMTKLLNQHIPHYCGSCWAHGSLSALADRIKIGRKAQFPDRVPAIQVVLNCGGMGSCFTNSTDKTWSNRLVNASIRVYEYVHENGVPDDTCMPYTAVSHPCTPVNICQNCASREYPYVNESQSHCEAVMDYPKLHVDTYGRVVGEAAIMQEVQQRGPVSCSLDADPLGSYTDGILGDADHPLPKEAGLPDHVVSIFGWGENSSGEKYWLVRNSWGSW